MDSAQFGNREGVLSNHSSHHADLPQLGSARGDGRRRNDHLHDGARPGDERQAPGIRAQSHRGHADPVCAHRHGADHDRAVRDRSLDYAEQELAQMTIRNLGVAFVMTLCAASTGYGQGAADSVVTSEIHTLRDEATAAPTDASLLSRLSQAYAVANQP